MKKQIHPSAKHIITIGLFVIIFLAGFLAGRLPIPGTAVSRIERLEQHAESVFENKPILIGQSLQLYLQSSDHPKAGLVEARDHIDVLLATTTYPELDELKISLDQASIKELNLFLKMTAELIGDLLEDDESDPTFFEDDHKYTLLRDIFIKILNNGFANSREILSNLQTQEGKNLLERVDDYLKQTDE